MGVDRPIDITPDQRKTILALLKRHLPNTTAWAYGSRVKWTARPQSDLDLVVFTTPEQERRVSELREAFEESNLPFRVDLLVWRSLPEQYRKQIEADHVVLVEKEEQRVAGTWRVTTLDQLGRIITGKTPHSHHPEYFGGEIPFVTPTDLTGRRRIESTERHLTEQGAMAVCSARIPSETIMVSCIGSDMGKSAIAVKACVTNQQINSIIVESADNPLFVYYTLSRRKEEIRATASGSAQPILNKSAFGQLDIVLPPPSEQRAIAHVLGTLDDKIELNRRMNETLEAMARTLFKSWFIDFDPVRAKMAGRDPGLPQHLANLFPDRLVDSELGPIPEGWEVSTIGQEVDVVGGSTPSTKDPVFWNGTINWATPKDLSSLESPVLVETSRKITEKGLDNIGSGLLPRGTVLLSSRAPIGYLAISDVPAAINQGFIAMKCQKRLSNTYVWLWTAANMAAILENANGSTFQEISKSNFRPLRVIVPHVSVRKTYDKLMQRLYNRIVKNERQSRTLAALRDTLLPKLISGEIKVENEVCYD